MNTKRGKVIKSYKYCQENLLTAISISILFVVVLGVLFLFFFQLLYIEYPLFALLIIIIYIPFIIWLITFYLRQVKFKNSISQIRVYENGDIRINYAGTEGPFVDYSVNKKYLTKVIDQDIAFAGRTLIFYFWNKETKKENWNSISLKFMESLSDYLELRDFMSDAAIHSKFKHISDNAEEGKVTFPDPRKTD